MTWPRTVLHRLGGLVGGQHAGLDPLLEQLDLEGERVVPLGEEGQRLLGRPLGVLPDGALAVGGPHVDGSVVVDASPLLLVTASTPLDLFTCGGRPRVPC